MVSRATSRSVRTLTGRPAVVLGKASRCLVCLSFLRATDPFELPREPINLRILARCGLAKKCDCLVDRPVQRVDGHVDNHVAHRADQCQPGVAAEPEGDHAEAGARLDYEIERQDPWRGDSLFDRGVCGEIEHRNHSSLDFVKEGSLPCRPRDWLVGLTPKAMNHRRSRQF